jgi:DHA2 family multidrug resistance protein-like MFS transporter
MLTPRIVRHARPALVMASGLVLSAAGFAMLTQVQGPWALAVLVGGIVLYSLGLAPVFTLATDLIVGSAPPERAGAAAAISETGSELGGALGIAILGSIGTAVYRREVAAGIPEVLASDGVAAARDTLGGALAAADRLPEPLAAHLRDASRLAFTDAMDWVSIACVAVVLVTALLAVPLLRQVRPVETGQ